MTSKEICSLFASIDRVYIPKDTLIVEPGQTCSMYVPSPGFLISPVSSFSPEPSKSPSRERKTRSGRVPPPTPSSSFPKFCFNFSILLGKAFSYQPSLILVDHCTRSHQRGNPRLHSAFPALLGTTQNRLEFGQHANLPHSARSSLRRFAVFFL